MAAVVSKIDPEQLARLSRDMKQARRDLDEARDRAISSLRLLESRVTTALDGGHLRALANIAPPWHLAPYYAQRVHPQSEGVRYRGLPKDGREVLVITKRGTIALAMVDGDANTVVDRYVSDEELQVEDLEPIACAFAEVVERHAERLERGSADHARARALAERLTKALGG